MSTMVEILIFATLGVVLLYPYMIYPAVLGLFTRKRKLAPTSDGKTIGRDQPRVSILLAVHNEEEVIADKIHNFLAQEYPEDKLELIVVSDGSTDGTEEIINSMRAPRVTLLVQRRGGKTAALNAAAEIATGKIFVFTDANTMFLPDAISQLVRHFDDVGVGLVSGQAVDREQVTSEGLYQRFERYLKVRESQLRMIAGADGAIYALRSEIWTPLDQAVINDLFHPIQVAICGARAVFDADARAIESSTEDVARQFARQNRMAAQAAGVLCRNLGPLACRGRLWAVWILVSHRVLRWLHAPLMAIALLMFGYLGWSQQVTWGYWLVGGYMGALVVGRLGFSNSIGRLFRMFYEFELVHLAYFVGILDFLRGRTHVTWNPRGGIPADA